jgi:hypothetical protein
MQHHAAEKLHVEMPLAQCTECCFTHGCEGLNQNIVKRLTGFETGPKLRCLPLQVVIGELLDVRFRRVDRVSIRSFDDPNTRFKTPPIIATSNTGKLQL